jgi:hypothetical protein
VHAVSKYLAEWAEPEIALAHAVVERYERCVVVPACREEATLLDGYVAAAETSRGRTLCILVVNSRDDAAESVHDANARLVEAVRARLEHPRDISGGPPAWLGSLRRGALDVLLLDRSVFGCRVPRKEGVGLARKIGADIALALRARGNVASRLIYSTDADATLPLAHFDQPTLEEAQHVSGACFPFWHAANADAQVTHATALYELSLRYYVSGLEWAGSPYAFHTLGSAIAFGADAYAMVRGFPKREAAEDFYLLNKIAKVGVLARALGAPIHLASRISDRVPFGTGAAVNEALSRGERAFYHPDCFSVLRDVLAHLGAFATHGNVDALYGAFDEFSPAARAAIFALLTDGDTRTVLEAAGREAKNPVARLRRVHTWFDAFRTLKLVHALRKGGFDSVPWREALAAPFAPRFPTNDDSCALVALRAAFALAEGRARPFLGPFRS